METDELDGIWDIDPADEAAIKRLGNVSIHFMENGILHYIIHCQDKDQIIVLTYIAKESILYTNQPSAPREERTEYHLNGETLVLMFGGKTSSFRKRC